MAWMQVSEICDSYLFRDPVLLRVWLLVLSMASERAGKAKPSGCSELVDIQPGEFLTTRRKFAAAYNADLEPKHQLSPMTIWRRLEQLGPLVEPNFSQKWAKLSVRNWHKYQGVASSAESKVSQTLAKLEPNSGPKSSHRFRGLEREGIAVPKHYLERPETVEAIEGWCMHLRASGSFTAQKVQKQLEMAVAEGVDAERIVEDITYTLSRGGEKRIYHERFEDDARRNGTHDPRYDDPDD